MSGLVQLFALNVISPCGPRETTCSALNSTLSWSRLSSKKGSLITAVPFSVSQEKKRHVGYEQSGNTTTGSGQHVPKKTKKTIVPQWLSVKVQATAVVEQLLLSHPLIIRT